MNKLLLSASLLAIAIPGTAYAGEPYIGLSGGIVIPGDSTNEGTTEATVPATAGFPAIASGTDFSFDTEFDMGWTAGGQVGYAFDNGFRVEVDGFYTAYDVKNHSNLVVGGTNVGTADSAILTRGPASASNPTVNQFLANSGGDVETYGGFLNALYDFDLGGVKPYLGAGVGLQWVDIDYLAGGRNFASDSRMQIAAQGIAGLSAELSDNVELFAEYKYRRLIDSKELDVQLLPASMTVEAEQHLATAGLRFRFGGAPVAVAPPPPPPPPPVTRPAPPPPPPPPPPPAARQCNTGPYIVFFDWDKSDITAEAASVLNSAVTAYGDCGTAAIMLAGHADRSGSTQYNVGLSERRNAAVQSYLAGRGIPAARISSQAFGEGQNRVATADGVRELQNRRVEISYGPGSGR